MRVLILLFCLLLFGCGTLQTNHFGVSEETCKEENGCLVLSSNNDVVFYELNDVIDKNRKNNFLFYLIVVTALGTGLFYVWYPNKPKTKKRKRKSNG